MSTSITIRDNAHDLADLLVAYRHARLNRVHRPDEDTLCVFIEDWWDQVGAELDAYWAPIEDREAKTVGAELEQFFKQEDRAAAKTRRVFLNRFGHVPT